MAVASRDEDLLRYLRALGMPERCVKFTLTAEVDCLVTATATFYPEIDAKETITKRFVLVEEVSSPIPPPPPAQPEISFRKG
jgi:hypothetical protein